MGESEAAPELLPMWKPILDILLLLMVANGAPIIAAKVFRGRAAQPVDFGIHLADHQPLFGSSKTWRGLVTALLSCAICAPLLGSDWYFGLVFASLAMTGDLASSFVKRRLGMAPSERCIGLDQLPEAALDQMEEFEKTPVGDPATAAIHDSATADFAASLPIENQEAALLILVVHYVC